jgi:hypothetical protein
VNRREQRWPVTLAKVSLALVGCLFLGLADECDRSDPHGMHARHEKERPIRRSTNALLQMSRASTVPLVRDFTFSVADGLFTSTCHGTKYGFWSLREIEPHCFESANAVYCIGTRCAHEVDVDPLFGIDRRVRNHECPTDCSYDRRHHLLRRFALRDGQQLVQAAGVDSRAHDGVRRWGRLGTLLAALLADSRSETRGFLSQLLVDAIWQRTCDELGVTPPQSLADSTNRHLDAVADLRLVFIECDFVKLEEGALRYRNGAWVAVPQ